MQSGEVNSDFLVVMRAVCKSREEGEEDKL